MHSMYLHSFDKDLFNVSRNQTFKKQRDMTYFLNVPHRTMSKRSTSRPICREFGTWVSGISRQSLFSSVTLSSRRALDFPVLPQHQLTLATIDLGNSPARGHFCHERIDRVLYFLCYKTPVPLRFTFSFCKSGS